MNKANSKICAIISGGTKSTLVGIDQASFVIACDKGYEYAQDAQIVPDLYVGDFDSFIGVIDKATQILDLPREKDDTDTMAAVRYAISAGYNEIRLYCALGGRIDHLVGNLQVAKYIANHNLKAKIISDESEITVFTNGSETFTKQNWQHLSVLALSDECTGVSIDGAKYPLSDAAIQSDFPIGVSNEWLGERIDVSIKSGALAVITTK